MRDLTLISFVFFAGLLTSCANNVGRSWVAPDMRTASLQKLGVVALTKQEVYRREAEWALAQELGDRGLASYTVLPELRALRDTAAVVRTLRENGCDGIVTLQLKSGKVRPDIRSAPRPAASPAQVMDDYWVDPSAQDVMAFAAGQYFTVEVHVFDLAKGGMVYNGLVVEQGARDTQDLVRMVRRTVMNDLRRKGVVGSQR
ncbi:MAG: hypothetical protein JNM31_14710 [Flavobacteriales bacterium]|nr:hypothetical protein [Flavobacteriales bacterium]